MTTDEEEKKFREDYPDIAKSLDELKEWITLEKITKKTRKQGKITTEHDFFGVKLEKHPKKGAVFQRKLKNVKKP
jgi:hypothetical protein